MSKADENRRYRAKVRAIIDEFKRSFDGCVDCGRSDLPLEVYDLDHEDGEKEFRVSSARYSIPRVQSELAKCKLRCPTCHRMRHYREKYANMGT